MKLILLSAMIAAFALSACSTNTSGSSRLGQAGQAVDGGLNRFGEGGVRSGGVQLSDRSFVAAQRETNSSAARLPQRVQGSNAVLLQSRDPLGIADIASRLTEITKIPHNLALGPAGIRLSPPQLPEGLSPFANLNDFGAGDTAARQAAAQRSGESEIEKLRMRPNLRGPLSDVLNEVAATFNVEWSYSDGQIIFRDFVTREYSISALPLSSQVDTSISSNDIGTSTSATLDIWGEITEALGQMLSAGATLSVGESTGTIAVTARVSDHARIANYVQGVNQRVGQQVSFDVNVITVILNEGENFGVDLNAALNRSNLSISAVGETQIEDSVGSINIGVIRNNASVQAVANSLAQFGEVSVETRAGTTTANNRPAPIEVIDSIAYISQVSVEAPNIEGGRERVLRTPDTVDIGFQMQLLPRVMNTRDIMVHYTVRISELNNMATFGDGNEAIQLPEVSTTSFEQQAVVENGQTLIMAGFERRRVEREQRRGMGLMALSRSDRASTQRVATVIMITPAIVRR